MIMVLRYEEDGNMKIHSARLGFATNSSSTHSPVLFSGKALQVALGADDVDVTEPPDFGWEPFTVSKLASKQVYLSAQIIAAMRGMSRGVVALLLKGLGLPDPWYGDGVGFGRDAEVDHQSTWTLPDSWRGVGPNVEFLADLRAAVERDGLVILGGNDNDDGVHPMRGSAKSVSWAHHAFTERGPLVARKDGAYWVLFNRDEGTKVRFSFDDDARPFKKATRPELVDWKITDRCFHECAYCYAGSTPGGHTGGGYWTIMEALCELQPFEVVLGGGEPLLHSGFEHIVGTLARNGIAVSFTTRQLEWLFDPARVHAAFGQGARRGASSFAVSVDNAQEVMAAKRAVAAAQVALGRKIDWAVQYVVGGGDLWGLPSIASACSQAEVKLVLLGFKTDGRGAAYATQRGVGPKDWLEDLAKFAKSDKYVRIGVDAAIVEKYGKRLHAIGVNDVLTAEATEGAFSCFIDTAREGPIVAASSYGEGLQKAVELTEQSGDASTCEQIVTAFQCWWRGDA